MIRQTGSIAIGLPSDIYKGVVVEVGVLKKGLNEATGPGTRCMNIGVVTIIEQIWSDEKPLWQLLSLQLFIETP